MRQNKDVLGMQEAIREREKEISRLNEEIKEAVEAVKKKEGQLLNSEKTVRRLVQEHGQWIETEKEFFGVAGHRYHFEKMNMNKMREECRKLREENEQLGKRINLKVDAMFEKTESQYLDLQRKKATTEENKHKFQDTIKELDLLKKKEMEITWRKVDKYFSEIFSTLL